MYLKEGIQRKNRHKSGYFLHQMKYLPSIRLFDKKNSLYLQRCLYPHFYCLIRFTVVMKSLLKGMCVLAFSIVAIYCFHMKSHDVNIEEFKMEELHKSQYPEFLNSDIQHQPLIFTAGKVWQILNEIPDGSIFPHSC